MIEAYKQGKDLYAMIASKVYHNNYEDNLEHHTDGSDYPDGKKRRKSVKGLLLGKQNMPTNKVTYLLNGVNCDCKQV